MPRGLENKYANRNEGLSVLYFGGSRGNLVMVVCKGLKFVVFELAADYSGWVAKYTFRVEAAAAAFPEVSEVLEGLVSVLSVGL